MLRLTTHDRGFLAALKIASDLPVTPQRMESQIAWLYDINRDLSAEATELRRQVEAYEHKRKLHRSSRAVLLALLLVSVGLNVAYFTGLVVP